jgi:hypothetical protein
MEQAAKISWLVSMLKCPADAATVAPEQLLTLTFWYSPSTSNCDLAVDICGIDHHPLHLTCYCHAAEVYCDQLYVLCRPLLCMQTLS